MRVISFNVNGIRSALNKGLLSWLKKENPDLFCMQEIKANTEQVDVSAFQSIGYSYSLINSAHKKGYSGVAIFSKIIYDNYVFGMPNFVLSSIEGRLIRANFGSLTVVCIYVPSGSSGVVRQTIKMKFLEELIIYLLFLRQENPNLLICGDYNICRQSIDIHNPKSHINVSGFLPEERDWFNRLILHGFVDSFREFNNESNYYTWWSYRLNARVKNLGWRIDYHLISENIKNKLISSSILTDVKFSDHCPIGIELNIK